MRALRVTGSLLCPPMVEGARELLGLFAGAFIPGGTSLVVWWFKNLPANVGTLVLSLAQELDPTCSRVAKPVHRNY